MATVMTVCGPVEATALGFGHSHEHVLWDYWRMIRSYECVMDDESTAISELQRFRAAGGSTIVDCSTVGIRTDPLALRRVSQASGVNIVLGCGWYRECVYPAEVFEHTVPSLAEMLIRDIVDGIAGTDVKAGLIGEIGTERGVISPAEERVFRAAARAHRETGVAILTHTTHFGELALEQIDLLGDAGVSTDRIIISHLGDRVDPTMMLEIARRGVFLSIDNIGYSGDGYPGDDVRAANVARLVEDGFRDQILLGTDISTTSALASYGGRGYDWLLRSFIPRLLDLGLTDADVHAMTVDTLARALEPSV